MVSIIAASAHPQIERGADRSLLSADTRALPFVPGTRFEVFKRANECAPWVHDSVVTLNVDTALVARDPTKSNESYSFHPIGGNRYLIEAKIQDGYAYGSLAVQNGEHYISHSQCDRIDQSAFEKGGGIIDKASRDHFCNIKTARQPFELLRAISATAPATTRAVPIK